MAEPRRRDGRRRGCGRESSKGGDRLVFGAGTEQTGGGRGRSSATVWGKRGRRTRDGERRDRIIRPRLPFPESRHFLGPALNKRGYGRAGLSRRRKGGNGGRSACCRPKGGNRADPAVGRPKGRNAPLHPRRSKRGNGAWEGGVAPSDFQLQLVEKRATLVFGELQLGPSNLFETIIACDRTWFSIGT